MNQNEIIKQKRLRATESLQEAKLLLKDHYSFGSVNRIYYALFYEISALLLTEGFSTSKHQGVMLSCYL